MNEEPNIVPSGSKIRQAVRLLVFNIGKYTMSTMVDQVRTIIDLQFSDEAILYDTDYSCTYTSGNVTVNAIDLHRLIFPGEEFEHKTERKLIIVKTNLKSLNGIIVDSINGVGVFEDLYPFPQGVFKLRDGVFNYVVTSEEPWFEVVDLPKIVEIYGFQPAKVENA